MARLLADAGSGVIETYVVRTLLAVGACLLIAPPRDIPLRALPGMLPRAVFVSAHFLVVLIAVQDGNPAVVQTAAATVPLVTVGFESLQHRQWPSARVVAAAVVAAVGVAIVLLV